jgi:tRNA G18 (ribose-2'-O)-methylase SpoU
VDEGHRSARDGNGGNALTDVGAANPDRPATEAALARALRVSVDDPRIQEFRDVRERDLDRRRGLFVCEGESVLKALVAESRFALHSVLLGESRIEKLAPWLAQLPRSVPVFVLSQAEMDGLVGFPIHRGILALAHRGPALDGAQLLSGPSSSAESNRTMRGAAECVRALGVLGVVNHDNVGGLFRNAAAFDVRAVLLDGVTCDPLYRKAVRVSVGGALRVPFARMDDERAVVDALLAANFEVIALDPKAHESVDAWEPSSRVALVVGSEEPGLSPWVRSQVRCLRLSMDDRFDSLNVGVAAGIALHHAYARHSRVPLGRA